MFVGAGVLAMAVSAALLRMWKTAAVVLIACGACVVPAARVHLPPERAVVDAAARLKVMSVNAQYGEVDGPALLGLIDYVKPDVVVIQEYTPAMEARLGPALLERMPFRASGAEEGAFGMAVYSAQAFSGEPELFPEMPTGRGEGADGGTVRPEHPQIRVVVKAGGREVVVQGVHTYPPLGPAYLSGQRKLTRSLAAWAEGESRAVVMAGDFNFTVDAQEAGWLRGAGLVNTQTRWGRGPGVTWPDRKAGPWLWRLPRVRIDHVWVKGLVSEGPEIGSSVGTDHLPVWAEVGFDGVSAAAR